MSRNSCLSLRSADPLSKTRADAVTREKVNEYFKLLQSTLLTNHTAFIILTKEECHWSLNNPKRLHRKVQISVWEIFWEHSTNYNCSMCLCHGCHTASHGDISRSTSQSRSYQRWCTRYSVWVIRQKLDWPQLIFTVANPATFAQVSQRSWIAWRSSLCGHTLHIQTCGITFRPQPHIEICKPHQLI